MTTDFSELKVFTTQNAQRSVVLSDADKILSGEQINSSLEFEPAKKLVSRLVDSKQFITSQSGSKIKVGLVFAMWGEVNRIQPYSKDNPNGEDCINDKLRSLDWLFSGTEIDWHIYGIDDDCPNDSGKVAIQTTANSPLAGKLTIKRLSDNHPFSQLPLERLKKPEDSTKGGAIIYGLQLAIEDGCDYVCYTEMARVQQTTITFVLLALMTGVGASPRAMAPSWLILSDTRSSTF